MDKTKKRQIGGQSESLWLNSLMGGLIGIGVMLISALLLPLIIINTDNPNSLLLPAAIICTALGSFAGGFVSARKAKGEELISGIITALTILLPLALISFIYGKGFSLINFGIIAAVIIGLSVFASYLVAKAGTNKKQNMKKLMKKPR
ncbi:MAG: TIGR04086 family membrane protein [Ruminococcaceae bacterium]|nr:TIGR04086 family membrane protein [Oscillospiraceae bacterium]